MCVWGREGEEKERETRKKERERKQRVLSERGRAESRAQTANKVPFMSFLHAVQETLHWRRQRERKSKMAGGGGKESSKSKRKRNGDDARERKPNKQTKTLFFSLLLSLFQKNVQGCGWRRGNLNLKNG